jgi:hypothetical protein
MRDSETQGTAIDFASRTIFDGISSRGGVDCSGEEIENTLRELIESFGNDAVQQAIHKIPAIAANELSEERLLQAIRGYSVIILEARYPKFVAQLVGKIAKMEITTGKRIDLRQLGATIGVSKQAASKQMANLAQRLGLPRPDSNETARHSHALMNRRNYGATKTA